MGKAMQHWNFNFLCAIDCETTGLDPEIHELIQIAILPLDSEIKPINVMPFYIVLKPDCPELIDPKAMKINKLTKAINTYGLDREKAKDLLGEWVVKLGMGVNKFGTAKTITPLGHNYAFDKAFMIKWLGVGLYNEYFHPHYRDTLTVASFIDDYTAWRAEDVPFGKKDLTWVADKVGYKRKGAHDALQDCVTTANAYRLMLQKGHLI